MLSDPNVRSGYGSGSRVSGELALASGGGTGTRSLVTQGGPLAQSLLHRGQAMGYSLNQRLLGLNSRGQAHGRRAATDWKNHLWAGVSGLAAFTGSSSLSNDSLSQSIEKGTAAYLSNLFLLPKLKSAFGITTSSGSGFWRQILATGSVNYVQTTGTIAGYKAIDRIRKGGVFEISTYSGLGELDTQVSGLIAAFTGGGLRFLGHKEISGINIWASESAELGFGVNGAIFSIIITDNGKPVLELFFSE